MIEDVMPKYSTVPILLDSVTLDKLLNLSENGFPPLKNGATN